MTKLSLFLLCGVMLLQCKTKDYLTPHEYDGKIIEFGSGGGFTGKVSHYTLMDNGQIFMNADKEGFVDAVTKIDKAEVKQVFDNYDSMNFIALKCNDPGNMYHFITMKHQDLTHKLMWGGNSLEIPKELEVFHAILMKKVKLNKPSTAKSFPIK